MFPYRCIVIGVTVAYLRSYIKRQVFASMSFSFIWPFVNMNYALIITLYFQSKTFCIMQTLIVFSTYVLF